jgi:hypothetical protein
MKKRKAKYNIIKATQRKQTIIITVSLQSITSAALA